MDVHEAAARWNDLLMRTHLLWEECQRLRQEAETATEVRGGSFQTLGKVAAFAGVLETALRKARDDVKKYRYDPDRRRDDSGDDWLRRMDDLLGPEP